MSTATSSATALRSVLTRPPRAARVAAAYRNAKAPMPELVIAPTSTTSAAPAVPAAAAAPAATAPPNGEATRKAAASPKPKSGKKTGKDADDVPGCCAKCVIM